MELLPGALTTAGGLFLLLWYRTLAGLPVRLQPSVVRRGPFKWGVPAAGLVVFAAGLYLLGCVAMWAAAAALALSGILGFSLLKFDRYSANMRLICDHYLGVREAHPDMPEIEVLFLTARWRYPTWSHDRILELVAGKDIQTLILLAVVNENKINPISDWELYRSLKAKAERIARRRGAKKP
jgi:hypothetical protein